MTRAVIRVLGIDPGKRTGVALLDVDRGRSAVVALATWEEGLAEHYAAGLAGFMGGLPPDVVCIERVEHVHGSDRMGSSYAEGLARSNWIGGLLAGLARPHGIRVVTVQAGEWRAALAGGARATDAQVAQAIRLRCPGWPARSNEHQRDAASCALWAGLAPR